MMKDDWEKLIWNGNSNRKESEKKFEELLLRRDGLEAWNNWRSENSAEFLDFGEKYLPEADFSGANLSGVGLWESILRGADFDGANLSRANFSRSDLGGASFCEANLSQANFSEAFFTEMTNFSEANLSEANFSKSNLRADL
ncbi:MAG: pentapeptide repeat-containing protein [Leptolyngbyaceae cyanobacterium SM1_3_5]|nr:pentapeptide repeat-containing protein [Leptolyngbyaceae cyanobacterium SM1_3_5]